MKVGMMDLLLRLVLITSFYSKLEGVNVVNVYIDKNACDENYNIFENAFKYLLQRVANDLKENDPNQSFITIIDEGRYRKTKNCSRKVRAFNPVPFKNSSEWRDLKHTNYIEDVFEKPSCDCPFIQFSDLLATLVRHYEHKKHAKRFFLNRKETKNYLEKLKENNILNLKAHPAHPYGIVVYRKRQENPGALAVG